MYRGFAITLGQSLENIVLWLEIPGFVTTIFSHKQISDSRRHLYSCNFQRENPSVRHHRVAESLQYYQEHLLSLLITIQEVQIEFTFDLSPIQGYVQMCMFNTYVSYHVQLQTTVGFEQFVNVKPLDIFDKTLKQYTAVFVVIEPGEPNHLFIKLTNIF